LVSTQTSRNQVRTHGELWAFSGLDAAGKSTQVDLLIDALAKAGRPGVRLWARGGYTPAFSLAKRIARAARVPGIPQDAGRTPQRERVMRRGLVRKIWLTLAILDLAIYYGVWIRVLKAGGRDVVADRYVIDTEIDFALSFPEERVHRWPLWRVVKRFVPAPRAHFVMLVPVGESLRRSAIKGEPFPDKAPVLAARLACYERMLERAGAVHLDATLAPADLHRRVIDSCGLDR
jgi:thymidylate kinase